MEDRLRNLRLEDFETYVGEAFTLHGAAGRALTTQLDHARPLGGSTVPEARRKPFAIIFTSEDKDVLPQQTVTLTHETMGSLEIFVVPVGPDPGGRMQYEAVFT